MEGKRIGIIGGGASGLMAAVSAAWEGAVPADGIVILEKKERIGKKLLATGNGKCNLTNLDLDIRRPEAYYRGEDPGRLKEIFSRFSGEDAMERFRRLGVLLTARNGYIYPLSGQASTVLDAFRFELERLGVAVETGQEVRRIRKDKDAGFVVETDTGSRRFDRVILACGTPAGGKRGEGMDGYRMASALGHTVRGPWPALVQLCCSGDSWKAVAGVRCMAAVRLHVEGKGGGSWRERGELLLTDYGLSGIPIFQLSRFASRALAEKRQVRACIDFLPDFEKEGGDWKAFCRRRSEDFGNRRAEVFFAGLGNKKLLQVLLKKNGLRPQDIISGQNVRLAQDTLDSLRRWEVEVVATNPFSSAQVCAGGVPLGEVTDQMESLCAPGLYLAGELLDVDGRCGGYNLQWAWTSGSIAGRQAALGCGGTGV